MKTALSSFDLKVLVAEWQDLVSGYVDKAYQNEDEVILRINIPGRERAELYSKSGRWLCLHEVEGKPETPPPFAQTLRRILDNARITAVEQQGFDRIAIFSAERGPDKLRIVFELFGKGNLIIVKGDTTLACLSPQAYKDRVVRPDEPYAFPAAGIDPLELDRAGLASAIRAAKGQVVRVLASVLNLGGQYAEELCLRANLDKDTKVKDLTEAQLDALYTALNNLVVAIEQERRPCMISKEGHAIDATPIDLVQNAGYDRQEFATFNAALSQFLTVAEPEAARVDEDVAKFERRIAQQQETLKTLREDILRCGAQAEFLYGHFQPFEELLRTIREGRAPVEGGQIQSIDRRTHTVTVGIADFDALVLRYDNDVTANAQDLYERRREAQLKAQRVEEALEATRKEMQAARTKAVKAAKKPKIKGTKAMWFEAYRWTLSSEGYLLLGGRDARSNDQLVKKHLKDGDRYAHADLHGAPSTVVKDGSKAGEATLREACEFALFHSKAWSAGIAGGSAYWVLPEQVSKQAESGEFLPRGAFVIRGKRNYFHDLPVRMAIGEVLVDGHRKIMGGPVSAVRAQSSKYVVLSPGKENRERLAKRLAAVFEVPIEEIVRALPPGGVEIVEAASVAL